MPPRVSIALLMSFLACAAFFGELVSKKYTKMFVSRKNLPFIHLVPAEASPRLHMLQSLHQGVELLRAATSNSPLAPVASPGFGYLSGQEILVQRFAGRAGNRTARGRHCGRIRWNTVRSYGLKPAGGQPALARELFLDRKRSAARIFMR
jgi:hypothetical protein